MAEIVRPFSEVKRTMLLGTRAVLRAQVARLEGEKAAMAAAVDKAAGLLGEEYLRTRNLTVGSVAVGLRAALSPDAGKGWLPPKVGEQDVEAAIYFMEQAKTTHEEWAAYVISGGELPEFVGDLKRHQEYIQEYEHTIAVLCATLDALKGVE